MNNTKRNLLTSVLSLILCCTMLLGTTLAWFTDSEINSGNKIQAGTLNVTLKYHNGEEGWVNAEGEPLFNYDKWEPGYMAVQGLRVGNAGKLALKWKAVLNTSKPISELGDVIDVYVKAGKEYVYSKPTSRSDVEENWDKAGTLKEFIANFANVTTGILEKEGETAELGIALVMREDAENKYQGLDLGGDISLIIHATQQTSEKDSYGNDYDEGAAIYKISTAQELFTFAKNVNNGIKTYENETVILTNDIDLENVNWTPIGNWDNAFLGSFDGQGHKISNLKINKSDLEGAGLFGVVDKNVTIKNVTLENVDITAKQLVGSIIGYGTSNLKVSNCHVIGDINIEATTHAAGILGRAEKYVIEGCSVISEGTGSIKTTENAVGGIVAWMPNSGSTINNCTVKNINLTGWANVGAISGFIYPGGTIDKCNAENMKLEKTRNGGAASIGLAAGGFSYSATSSSTITNNTFKNITMKHTSSEDFYSSVLYGSEYSGGNVTNVNISNNTLNGTEIN